MKKIIAAVVAFSLLLFILSLLVFIGPHYDIAIFDSQCKVIGSDICSANPGEWNQPRLAYERATYGCLRDCRVRGFRCSFDTEYSEKCFLCINKCDNRQSDPNLNMSSCYAGCR